MSERTKRLIGIGKQMHFCANFGELCPFVINYWASFTPQISPIFKSIFCSHQLLCISMVFMVEFLLVPVTFIDLKSLLTAQSA